MEQYAGLIWVVLLGPPETNRRKPFCFYGRLPVAQLICCELYFVSLGASSHIFFVGASLILPTTVGAPFFKHLTYLLEFNFLCCRCAVSIHSSKLRVSSASALMDSICAAGSFVTFYS